VSYISNTETKFIFSASSHGPPWEFIPELNKVANLYTYESGMHSHAEHGNERKTKLKQHYEAPIMFSGWGFLILRQRFFTIFQGFLLPSNHYLPRLRILALRSAIRDLDDS